MIQKNGEEPTKIYKHIGNKKCDIKENHNNKNIQGKDRWGHFTFWAYCKENRFSVLYTCIYQKYYTYYTRFLIYSYRFLKVQHKPWYIWYCKCKFVDCLYVFWRIEFLWISCVLCGERMSWTAAQLTQDDRWPTWLTHSTCDFVLRPPWKRKRRVNRGFGAAGAYPCQQLTDWMSTMNFTIPQFHGTISEVRDGKEWLSTTWWCRISTLKIFAWFCSNGLKWLRNQDFLYYPDGPNQYDRDTDLNKLHQEVNVRYRELMITVVYEHFPCFKPFLIHEMII